MSIENQINVLLAMDEASVQPRLATLLEELGALSPSDRASFVPELCRQIVLSRSPCVAGSIAVAVGALVEEGTAPEALGEAVLEALKRWLPQAGRHAQSPSAADEEASDAYASLDLWWRAAVAAWSRAPQFIPRARRALEAALGQLEHEEIAEWLLRLCATSVDEPFVFMFPELREAHQCTVNGVSLVGQLSILLSRALARPLARIGASGPADFKRSYDCSFRMYSWQALDPKSGMPVDGKFRWKALGGSGTHSLPEDFQPSKIEPLGEVRVMAVVGPRVESTLGGVRELGWEQMFDAMKAQLSDVTSLGASGFDHWLARIRAS